MKRMKRASKVVAMLMVLIMTLSLSACGNSGKSLVGTWSISCDLNEMMIEEMGDDYADFESSFVITLKFDFNEDGTFKMYADREELKASLDSWLNDFISYSVEMTYAIFEEQGIDRETADELIVEQYGASLEDTLRQQIEGSLDADQLADSVDTDGVYETKGNKLYMSDNGKIDETKYDIFSVSGDTLKLELPEGAVQEEVIPGLEYPLSLTKEK